MATTIGTIPFAKVQVEDPRDNSLWSIEAEEASFIRDAMAGVVTFSIRMQKWDSVPPLVKQERAEVPLEIADPKVAYPDPVATDIPAKLPFQPQCSPDSLLSDPSPRGIPRVMLKSRTEPGDGSLPTEHQRPPAAACTVFSNPDSPPAQLSPVHDQLETEREALSAEQSLFEPTAEATSMIESVNKSLANVKTEIIQAQSCRGANPFPPNAKRLRKRSRRKNLVTPSVPPENEAQIPNELQPNELEPSQVANRDQQQPTNIFRYGPSQYCNVPECGKFKKGVVKEVDELGNAGPRCIKHGAAFIRYGSSQYCNIPDCGKFKKGVVKEADHYGNPGPRCIRHGARGVRCQVLGCGKLQQCKVQEVDEWGSPGPRCIRHSGPRGASYESPN